MKYKLDLHCHSIASDGASSLMQLAELAKKANLDGLVVTDHCRPNNAFQTNEIVLETLKDANVILPLPVIIGSEIRTPYGEFLLYGKKACKQWDYYKEQLEGIGRKYGVEQYWEMFDKFVLHKLYCERDNNRFLNVQVGQPLPYALAICHPRDIDMNWCKRMPRQLWKMVHGFEIQNGMEDYTVLNPEPVEWFLEHIPFCKALRNSDCHAVEVGSCWNELEMREVSEYQLIHWFRS